MAVILRLLVKAGAGRDALLGWQGRAAGPGGSGIEGDMLRVQVAAPPQGGRANRAVLGLLASALGVDGAQVKLLRGHRSSHKLVAVEGMEEGEVRRRLER